MQKKFITNLALLLFLNLLIKPFWILGIDRSVQNAVSPEIFGTYYALFNFTFLLNILLDLGITNFNNKNIAQNNHLLTKHVSSILSLRLLLGLVYTVITLSVGLIIGYSFGQLYVLFLLGFNQFLISFILYLRSNIAGLHLFKTDSIISVLDRLIMITICAILLWGHVTSSPFQIEWYVYAQTSAYLLTAIITMVIVIKKSQLKRLNWSKAFFLVILKKSYPYAILVLLMAFYNRIDTVMLERLLVDGAEQSAIYASAYRLLDSANMIAYLFAGLLLPIFARMIKLKHDLDELVKLAFSLLVTLSVIVALGSFFIARS
ncbi:MAG: oligosaccharide flippase family protein [Bacteroidetes bacterium]|nr:oligosaccharide flippase family protein [Bacteroidota bacterium]